MKIKKFFKVISIAFSLALLGTMLVSAPAAALVNVACTPDSGPQGTQVTVYAAGFTPGASVTVWPQWPPAPQYQTQASASGTVTYPLIVPASAVNGTSYSIYVYEGSTLVLTQVTTFTVTSGLAISPSSGNVGDTVTISGTGFIPNTQYPILWDGATTIKTVLANASGAISTTITVPDASRGSHTVSTTGVGSTAFTVDSKITLTPASGGSGDAIAVVGTGFAASATVTLTIGGVSFTPNISTTTSAVGRFNVNFPVPSTAARGIYTIRASDGGGYAEATLTVVPSITIALPAGQTRVAPGDVITISGTNFSTGAVSFKLDGAAISGLTATAGASGTFADVSYTVPNIAAGTHRLTAIGSDLYEDYADFNVGPKIAVTPDSGAAGTQVTVSGSGFIASSTVTVYYGNGSSSDAQMVTGATDASGNITGSVVFTIPASVKGTRTVTVKDASNSAVATFTVAPKITVSPASGVYNDAITVSGSGFAANADISLHIQAGQTEYYLNMIPSAVNADSKGSWSAVFTVPLVSTGNWNIKAYAGNNLEASTVLAVKASIVLSPDSGASGDEVSVSGFGFNPSKSITLKYNGAAIKTTGITTDGNGYFTAVFTTPASAAGTFSVEATDGFASAKADFVSIAGATISVTTDQNTPGYVGQEVTISGTGFKPSTPIIITIESTPIQVATVTSSAQGSFTATFTIPAVAKGNHVIRASDGTTTKEFAYYMEGTAPSKVELVAPVDKFKPKQPIPFSWNPKTDPSGVTYEFQLSQDASFATVLLSKTGLTASSYALSAADSVTINGKLYSADKLPSSGDKPYCWRVRAIDGAGNVGPWSEVNTFTIGFIMPSWMIHVWYGLGILVALILGLWLGRRMAYQSY